MAPATEQAGANSREFIEIKLPLTWANTMGLSGGLSVMNHALASNAIARIDEARNYVSGERSRLGAMQNRLEFAQKNADNMSEQTQASESRIRDVDMAKEYMEYVKSNLLAQTSLAMLAQANQHPQAVPKLLK